MKDDDNLVPAGFNYVQALLHISQHMNYERIAVYLGYRSRQAVHRVICGCQPAHKQGERIYILYKNLFGKSPPMSKRQREGVTEDVNQSSRRTKKY